MSTTSAGTRQNRERDANREAPTDLEDRPECGGARTGGPAVDEIERESGDGGDARENVEEDTGGFSHAFSEPARAGVFEVEFALGDRLSGHNVTGKVLLDGLGGTELNCSIVNKLGAQWTRRETYGRSSSTVKHVQTSSWLDWLAFPASKFLIFA